MQTHRNPWFYVSLLSYLTVATIWVLLALVSGVWTT